MTRRVAGIGEDLQQPVSLGMTAVSGSANRLLRPRLRAGLLVSVQAGYARVQESSWRHGVTRYQWLVLFVAWLGWVFDSMDATIYALVLHPALHDLLRAQAGGEVSQEAIGWYGGIILSIFLIGWAVGGVVFGIVADRFGRTRP